MFFQGNRRLLILIPVVFVVVGALALYLLPDWRNSLLANHYASRAEALEKAGAHEPARLMAIKALKHDKDCLPAIDLLLTEVPSTDTSGALFLRCRVADLRPGDLNNLRLLALIAINGGSYPIAAQAIHDLERRNGKPAEVLELRTRLAAAKGDFDEALNQAQFLLEKDPKNQVGHLLRALSQIMQNRASDRPAAEKELREILVIEPSTVEAQRGLRLAAQQDKDLAHALEYSSAIVAGPHSRFDDWLVHSDLLYQQNPEKLPQILTDLTSHADTNPTALSLIGAWLCKHARFDQIEAWVQNTKALQANPILAQSVRVQSLIANQAWALACTFLKPLNWKQLEYHRLALLARAERELNQPYFKDWSAATEAALKSPDTSRTLGEIVAEWPAWKEEYADYLWSIAKRDPSNLGWALSALSKHYQTTKSVLGLLRVSEELYRNYPSSESAQNMLAYYSLLQKTYMERAYRLSETLYVGHSRNPEFARTYALALLRQDKPKDALNVLDKLRPEQLASPDVAIVYTASLAGNGRLDEARKIRAGVEPTQLLPEELELVKFE